MHYYQRLKDMREDTDNKQQTIAKLLDIKQQQYSLYESGKREIPLHLAVRLADFYNPTFQITRTYNESQIVRICSAGRIPRIANI